MARRLAPGFRIGASFEARFSPDGRWLVTLGQRITLWDVATRQRVAKGPPQAHTSSVDISLDGTRVAAKNTSGEVLVLSIPDLTELARFPETGEGDDVLFAPDGRIVHTTWGGRLMVRDALTGSVEWEERRHQLSGIVATRDRSTWVYRLAEPETFGRLYLRGWPFEEAAEELPVRLGVPAISDDGRRLAVAHQGLQIWDRDGDWRLVAELDHLKTGGTGTKLSWHPDGSFLARSGGRRGTVFDLDDLEVVHVEDLDYPSDVHFAHAGDLLAFGAWDKGIVVPWPPSELRETTT